jgi:hypothetical protein
MLLDELDDVVPVLDDVPDDDAPLVVEPPLPDC